MPLHLHVCTLPADKKVYLERLKVGDKLRPFLLQEYAKSK